jgi:hypothetical protein
LGWSSPTGGLLTALLSKGERHEQRAERNAQQPPREAVVTPIAHDDPGNDAGRQPGGEKDGHNECARHDELPPSFDGAKGLQTGGRPEQWPALSRQVAVAGYYESNTLLMMLQVKVYFMIEVSKRSPTRSTR